jgi:hypothetical protein
MKVRTPVEPAEPMRGLDVPQQVVEALGGGKRPRVTITVNGHSGTSRVAIMRGRYLLGLSNANRQAAGVVTGDEVEVEVDVAAGPPVVVEPADFARALDGRPGRPRRLRPPGLQPQARARARGRERQEAPDAQAADRAGRGNAAGPAVGC